MAMDQNRVSELLKILSPLQEKVVRLYFGLGCQRSHSASEIAREFHVSSQVISGIIGGAERRLAHVGLTPSKLREAAERDEADCRRISDTTPCTKPPSGFGRAIAHWGLNGIPWCSKAGR